MFYHPWQISKPQKEKSDFLKSEYQISNLLCDVLTSRNLSEPSKVESMLSEEYILPDPMSLCGMQKAVDRILYAVDNGQRIVVFGDYDVDGVTATALVYSYLDSIGADVYYKLPNREDDGYGLFPFIIEELSAKKVQLIITVDTGISANEAVEKANELGIDIIITDHHLPPAQLPNALAIVDPKLENDNSNCKCLCGAGVAYMLICGLECCDANEMLPFYSDLAAIGTIADIMDLNGVNRHIVKAGLELINNTDRPGLMALIQTSGFLGKQITAQNVAFGISPRLNAAGRMDSAVAALELLLCDDEQEALERAEELELQNAARQKAEQEIAQIVFETINADPKYENERILVVANEDFHAGVIGIVASRVAERFGKPTIIISIDKNGEGKGSGRSIGGVSLYNAISYCEDMLIRFGGHELAAGLSISSEKIAEFREKINEWALTNHPTLQRLPIKIDTPVILDNINAQDVEDLEMLAPYGHGNPLPLFLLEKAVIEDIYPLSEGKHTRIKLRQNNSVLYAVMFNQNIHNFCYYKGDCVDIALSLSVYEGKNGDVISGKIKDIRPAGMSEDFIADVELFDALCCNAKLSNEQKNKLLPLRSDAADVYKFIKNGLKVQDLRPVFYKLGEKRAGKILVSLKAFCELGFISCESLENNVQEYKLNEIQQKKDLDTAPIMQILNH